MAVFSVYLPTLGISTDVWFVANGQLVCINSFTFSRVILDFNWIYKQKKLEWWRYIYHKINTVGNLFNISIHHG